MMKPLRTIIFFILVACLPMPAFAGWDWPDLSEIIQIIAKIYGVQLDSFEKLKNLDDIKTNTGNTVDRLDDVNKNIIKHLAGTTGYESLVNDMASRKWSGSWSDVLANNGGNPAFRQAQEEYAKMYKVADPSVIGGNLSSDKSPLRKHYEQSSQMSRAALAASKYSFNTVNEHMDNVNKILEKLKDSDTEKKTADLNARLVAEVSFIQLEILKQQNIQTQLIANQTQGDVNDLSDDAQFNQWQP